MVMAGYVVEARAEGLGRLLISETSSLKCSNLLVYAPRRGYILMTKKRRLNFIAILSGRSCRAPVSQVFVLKGNETN